MIIQNAPMLINWILQSSLVVESAKASIDTGYKFSDEMFFRQLFERHK